MRIKRARPNMLLGRQVLKALKGCFIKYFMHPAKGYTLSLLRFEGSGGLLNHLQSFFARGCFARPWYGGSYHRRIRLLNLLVKGAFHDGGQKFSKGCFRRWLEGSSLPPFLSG